MYLFYLDRRWLIGPTPGNGASFIYVADTAQCPTEVKGAWQAYSAASGQWVNLSLRIDEIAEQQHDEEKRRREAVDKAVKEAEEKAKKEAEERLKKEAEEKAILAAEKAKLEEEKARLQEEYAKKEAAVEQAVKEAEEKARREEQERAKKDAEGRASVRAPRARAASTARTAGRRRR